MMLGVTASLCPRLVLAQQPRVWHVGWLDAGSSATRGENLEIFRKELKELGYTEGRDMLIEQRFSEGNIDRLRSLAADLVRMNVDVILAVSSFAVQAAKSATPKIPIVMTGVGDPEHSGFVASITRPGGNITGLTSNAEELNGKRLELLKEAIPELSRVAVIRNSGMSGTEGALKDVELAAQSLRLRIHALEISGPNDLEGIFQVVKKGGARALMTIGDPVTFTHRKRVIDLAIKNRIATIHGQIPFAEAGGLMVYGPNDADMYRRAATFVDKILKGVKPADLPVERPVKFDLIINLKTAERISLTVPPNVLARADKVIR